MEKHKPVNFGMFKVITQEYKPKIVEVTVITQEYKPKIVEVTVFENEN